MKTPFRLLTCILLLVTALPTRAQTLDKIVADYVEKGYYREALERLNPHYETLKQQFADQLTHFELARTIYYRGTCYCRSGDVTRGLNNLDFISNRVKGLSQEMKKKLETERAGCGRNEGIPERVFLTQSPSERNNPVFGMSEVSGKDMHMSICNQTAPDFSSKTISVAPVPDSLISGRLFTQITQQEAERHFKGIFGNKFGNRKIDVSDHFILVNLNPGNRENQASPITLLENSLNYLAGYYNLKIPKEKITVYAVRSEDLPLLARTVHGLSVNENLIGYSNNSDLSIVSVSTDFSSGTILHEFMHILINSNNPFIPPWLAEGIPALYEASRKEGGSKISGIRNWRVCVLKNIPFSEWPSLKELISYGWDEFDGIEYDSNYSILKVNNRRQAINHALSRYFVLYLQEHPDYQHLLPKYLSSFSRLWPEDYMTESDISENLLLNSMPGLQNLKELEYKFHKWLLEENGVEQVKVSPYTPDPVKPDLVVPTPEKINMLTTIGERMGRTERKVRMDLRKLAGKLAKTEPSAQREILGYGKFKIEFREKSTRQNSRTGEIIDVPAEAKISMIPAKSDETPMYLQFHQLQGTFTKEQLDQILDDRYIGAICEELKFNKASQKLLVKNLVQFAAEALATSQRNHVVAKTGTFQFMEEPDEEKKSWLVIRLKYE